MVLAGRKAGGSARCVHINTRFSAKIGTKLENMQCVPAAECAGKRIARECAGGRDQKAGVSGFARDE